MKYQAIDNALFIENRKKFKNNLKPNSLGIFVSNDIMPTNADGSMGFKQNSDLFYLSGKFEISLDALRIIESTFDEDGIPSSQLFHLDCGQYNYQCGYVEKDG